MTIDEAKQAFAMMKKQGADDNTILGFLYNLFQNDRIDVNQLGARLWFNSSSSDNFIQ